MQENKKNLDIAWIGVDGLLVVGYFVLVGIILYAIIYRNDFIIGTVIPYSIMIAVTGIFINYLSVVAKFGRAAREKRGQSSHNGEDKLH